MEKRNVKCAEQAYIQKIYPMSLKYHPALQGLQILMAPQKTHSSPPSSVPTAAQKARRKSQPCHELAVSRHWASQAKRWANSGTAIIVRVIFNEKDRRFGGLKLYISDYIRKLLIREI